MPALPVSDHGRSSSLTLTRGLCRGALLPRGRWDGHSDPCRLTSRLASLLVLRGLGGRATPGTPRREPRSSSRGRHHLGHSGDGCVGGSGAPGECGGSGKSGRSPSAGMSGGLEGSVGGGVGGSEVRSGEDGGSAGCEGFFSIPNQLRIFAIRLAMVASLRRFTDRTAALLWCPGWALRSNDDPRREEVVAWSRSDRRSKSTWS
jgi:hypothetical protein